MNPDYVPILMYVAIILLAVIFASVLFFYQAYNTAKLARMAGYTSTWLAYIPVANMWLKASVGHESKKRAITCIVLRLATNVLAFGGLAIVVVGAVVAISADSGFESSLVMMGAGFIMIIVSAVISLIARYVIAARIDMAFVEAFEVEAGVAALTVNNVRGGWAYANLLSRIASKMDKGLEYRFDAPAF